MGFTDFHGFPQLSFGLMPELIVPSGRPVVMLPDFLGAFPDFIFCRLSHGEGSLFQFSGQFHDARGRFPIRHPSGEHTVFIGLGSKVADVCSLIHGKLHANKTMERLNCFAPFRLILRRESRVFISMPSM
jgi:hypothetical protein